MRRLSRSIFERRRSVRLKKMRKESRAALRCPESRGCFGNLTARGEDKRGKAVMVPLQSKQLRISRSRWETGGLIVLLKKLAFATALTLVAFTVSAQAQEPRRGGTIRFTAPYGASFVLSLIHI